MLLGAACLLRSPAALLVVFAFFTLIKTPGRAFGLLLAAAAVAAPIALWQRHAFWAYALKLPYSFTDLRTLGHDLPRAFAILIATLGVVPTLWRKPSLFAALMFASFVAALASHTLLFWIPFGCVALALLASRIEVLLVGNLLAARAGELLCAVVLAQLALLAYDPRAHRATSVAPTAASTPAPPHLPRRNTARPVRETPRACKARRAAAR
jgi:hypothetical protein